MAKKIAAGSEKKAVGPTPTVTIRMPENIRSQLQDIAEADDRSLSWLILKILKDYLDARKSKR
jgi:predicted transcriptional regulator